MRAAGDLVLLFFWMFLCLLVAVYGVLFFFRSSIWLYGIFLVDFFTYCFLVDVCFYGIGWCSFLGVGFIAYCLCVSVELLWFLLFVLFGWGFLFGIIVMW